MSIRSLGLVVLGALGAWSAGCGSSAPSAVGDAGAAGDGGGGGAGGAPGGGAGSGSARCTEFAPCGGDLVGAWRSDPGCTPATLSQAAPCQGETFDVTSVVPTSTWTFRADLTFTVELSTAGPVKVEATEACLATRAPGQAVTCTDASAGALYAGSIAFVGAKAGASTCQPRADGSCACTINLVADPRSAGGTYSTAGTVISTNLGSSFATIDFCVSGATLKMRSRPTSVNVTPTVSYFQKQ